VRRAISKLRVNPVDAVAGISVAVVLVPQSLGYAQLAGMPAYRGLFAAAIPPLVAAPFASSPYLQPGPTAISALLTYGALSPLATVGSAHYVELGILLALLVGLIRIAVGLLRAGVLAYFVSQPLLVGFVPAAAILIIASQIPALVGLRSKGGSELGKALRSLAHPSGWSSEAIALAVVVAVLLLLSKKAHPLFPAVILVVAAAVLFGRLGGYDRPRVGAIHASFPTVTTSLPVSDLFHLLVPAVVIALLGFAEASSIARLYATQDRARWDADREFVSQGVANLGAGLFGGFPVGASFSRSALNRMAGAKTNMSAFVTGLCVLAFIPLGFVLGPLPQSALAAIVIVAVLPLLRFDGILEVARMSRPQLAVTLTAFLLTLALSPHVQWAILAAVALSVLIHLQWELRLVVDELVVDTELELIPRGVLWFGTARLLEDRFTDSLAAHPATTAIVLRLEGLGRIDLTGAFALRSLIDAARASGIAVTVRGAPPQATRVLGRVLGPDLGFA
jgi:SulP family sulfate permease